MSSQFCLSLHFLDPAFHGRGDGGQCEWPPSPLRAFQALVTAGARRNGGKLTPQLELALRWLEAQEQPPVIVAPVGAEGSGYRLSVPNNAMDIVARAWSRGNESNSGDADPNTHRSMKRVRATLLRSGDAVHYLWALPDPLSDEIHGWIRALSEIARSVAALGWGIDMAVSHGAVLSEGQVKTLEGERWLPVREAGEEGLRVPVESTLEELSRRHEQVLGRLGPNGLIAPSPLSAYRRVEYRRATDPPPHSVAAFSLLKLDASGFQAFDTARKALTVAGMARWAVKAAAARGGWPGAKIRTFILGHGEGNDGDEHVAPGPRRFAYVPLPSIEARGGRHDRVAGSVRRVMVTSFAGDCDDEIAWARRTLSGQELVSEDTKLPVALLSLIPENEKVLRCYLQPASAWATVTPVVLPGYDDPRHYRRRLKSGVSAVDQKELLRRLDDRIEGLLRKAIAQAGYPQALVEHAVLEWRKAGFWPGSDLADRYGVPNHLKRFPRYHVKIQWHDAQNREVRVPGPVCFGGGRFCGLGLFAAV